MLDCDPIFPPIDQNGNYKNCNSSQFLEGILVEGGAGYFDVFSFHAYDYYYGALGVFQNSNWNSAWNTTGPTLIKKMDYIHKQLEKYNVNNKEFFCTELALLCLENCDDTFQRTKAYYVVQAYSASIVNGLKNSTWYTLVTNWRETSLVSHKYELFDAYYAYKFAHSMLGNAKNGSDISQEAIRIYEFNRPNGRVWVIWSLDGTEHVLSITGNPKAAWDLFGNNIAIGETVNVTIAPMYLEWGE